MTRKSIFATALISLSLSLSAAETSNPMQLSAEQMDRITAGGVPYLGLDRAALTPPPGIFDILMELDSPEIDSPAVGQFSLISGIINGIPASTTGSPSPTIQFAN